MKISFLSTNVMFIHVLDMKSDAGTGLKLGGWEWTPGLGKNFFWPSLLAFGLQGEWEKSRGCILMLQLWE